MPRSELVSAKEILPYNKFTWRPVVKNWLHDTGKGLINPKFGRHTWVDFPNCASIRIPRPTVYKNGDLYSLHFSAQYVKPDHMDPYGWCWKSRDPYQDFFSIEIDVEGDNIICEGSEQPGLNRGVEVTHTSQQTFGFDGSTSVSYGENKGSVGPKVGYTMSASEVLKTTEPPIKQVKYHVDSNRYNLVRWDYALNRCEYQTTEWTAYSGYNYKNPLGSMRRTTHRGFGSSYYLEPDIIVENLLTLNVKYDFYCTDVTKENTLNITVGQRLVNMEIWNVAYDYDHYFINWKELSFSLPLSNLARLSKDGAPPKMTFDTITGIYEKEVLAKHYSRSMFGTNKCSFFRGYGMEDESQTNIAKGSEIDSDELQCRAMLKV